MMRLLLLFSTLALAGAPAGKSLDPASLTDALGVEAKAMPDGAVKASWPRADVKVTVDGIPVSPPQGLTTWISFVPVGSRAMAMGDTMVFQDEVDAAMDAAFANGLQVTALHNHFFYDQPRVFFLHIAGDGDPNVLAKGVRAVWDAVKAVRAKAPKPSEGNHVAALAQGTLDPDALSKVLGQPVKVDGGVPKMVVTRHATMDGVDLGNSMGVTTWAAFAGSETHAVVDGDFVMTADEVQPVLQAMRKAGLHVVALHNHMIGETPACFFTHYWGEGSATDLAKAVRAALDAQAGS